MSIVLNSNSGTFSPIFVNILLKFEANPVRMSLWRFNSAATKNSKLMQKGPCSHSQRYFAEDKSFGPISRAAAGNRACKGLSNCGNPRCIPVAFPHFVN